MRLSDGTELPVRVRVHARARSVRLLIRRAQGLVVTVPPGYDLRRLSEVLNQNREWVERTLQELPAVPLQYRPNPIVLAAVGEAWTVGYESGDARRVTLRQLADRRLQVSGAIDHADAVRRVLAAWLIRQGRRRLVPWLLKLADELGFRVARVAVRMQNTRWGSCSTRNAISLNARLLLLPPRLVRFVMIHELVHTRHRNHSAAFWAAVAELVPEYRTLRAETRHGMDRLEI
jgi:hypothetical protein